VAARPALVTWVLAVGAAALATAVVITQPSPGPAVRQPAQIAALVQAYRADQPGGEPATDQRPPVQRADGFVWTQTRRTTLAGQPMIVHAYRRADGATSCWPAPRASSPAPSARAICPTGSG